MKKIHKYLFVNDNDKGVLLDIHYFDKCHFIVTCVLSSVQSRVRFVPFNALGPQKNALF